VSSFLMKRTKTKSESVGIKKSPDKNSKIGQNQYLPSCRIFGGPEISRDQARKSDQTKCHFPDGQLREGKKRAKYLYTKRDGT